MGADDRDVRSHLSARSSSATHGPRPGEGRPSHPAWAYPPPPPPTAPPPPPPPWAPGSPATPWTALPPPPGAPWPPPPGGPWPPSGQGPAEGWPPPPAWPPAGPTDGAGRARPGGPPTLQNLLLVLGTALIVGAVIVFTAVTWRRLDAAVQGAVLVGLTVVAVLATMAAARRRMPATAESVGLVAVALGLADAHALRIGLAPSADVALWWAGSLAALAAGAWSLGVATGVRSTRTAAAALAQVPLLLVLGALEADLFESGLALLAQAAVAVGAAEAWRTAPRPARAVFGLGAALTWLVVAAGAVIAAAFGEGDDRGRAALVLAVAAGVAGLATWLGRDHDGRRSPALLAATACGLAAVAAAAGTLVPDERAWGVLAVVAAVVLVVAARFGPRWRSEPVAVAGVASAYLATGVAYGLVQAGSGAAEALARAWTVEPGARASSLTLPGSQQLSSGALALHLLAVAVVVLGWPARTRGLRAATVVPFVLAVALAPVLLPLTVAATVAAALGGVLAALAVGMAAGPIAERLGGSPDRTFGVGAGAAAGTATVALAWSATDAGLTLLAVGLATLTALAFAVQGRRRGDLLVAPLAAALASIGGAGFVGLTLAAGGSSADVALVAGGATALLLGVAGAALLDPLGRRRDVDGVASVAVEWTTWSVHGLVLAQVLRPEAWDPAARLTLGAGVIAGAWHAVRPGRRGLAALAALEGLVLVWTQLGALGVRLPEAYTMPVAAALLVVGAVADRQGRATGRPVGSWVSLGPALLVAFAPSVLLGLTDPGTVRPLLTLVAGALVLAAGATAGRRAPVDVGAAAVALAGLRLVAPVVGDLPAWTTLAVTGTFLVAVGATFEQRRRDLRDVRDRYGELR